MTGLTAVVTGAGPSPAVAAPPDPAGPGWQVVDLGNGRFEVSWTSTADLPLGSDRPTITGDGLSFGPPTVDDDGRTVSAVVTAAAAPDPRVLDVLLSGDRLDEAGFDPSGGAAADALPERPTTTLAADDPGAPGPYSTATSDYELPALSLAGMPEPVEMVGHVVEPVPEAATGPRPLVLFLHGRHSVCYLPGGGEPSEEWPCQAPAEEIPSHLGYDYVQRLLASQGFATVSVRVNGINAQDYALEDGGADARATIVQAHLDHWAGLAAEHQLDLDQVVLVGHSRGGEGVDRAAIQVPLSAPYRIAGQVLLAPTNFASHAAAYVPTVTVLPYCDGDVYDLQGQRFTDVARDLAADDTSLQSSVLALGANHNFFNTEWTPSTAVAPAWDDWGGDPDATCGSDDPGRLSAQEQRDVGQAYIAGAVHLFTGDDGYLPMYDGSPVSVPSVGDADVLSHAVGGGRSLRRPGQEATPTVPGGGADVRVCTGVASYDDASFALCGRRTGNRVTPHWPSADERVPKRQFLEMSWESAGASGGVRFDDPLDLSGDRLELRTILDPRYPAPDLQVRLSDSSGGSAVLDPEPGAAPAALPVVRYATKLWAQSLVVDATAAAGVDLTDVTAVELVAGTAAGRLWLADLAAAPAALAPVPDVRLPHVDVGSVELDEGDSGRGVARVPFEVVGEVTRPARFVAFTAGETRGDTQRLVVDVAPGQTGGSIPVEYVSDTVAGFDQRTSVVVWPLRGIGTDDYLGSATVREDDPMPGITVRPVARTVREGRPLEFVVELEGPVGYQLYVQGRAVPGPGEPVRGTDVPLAWLRTHGSADSPQRPLWRLRTRVAGDVDEGSTRLVLSIPTRRDARSEGREVLRMRFTVGDRRITRQVTVVDRR